MVAWATRRRLVPSLGYRVSANLGVSKESHRTPADCRPRGVSRLLSALAMADGKLDAAAVKHLEKMYALLGIDGALL